MKTNVLVVDGDAAVREALGRLLNQAGYDVMAVADSWEAAEVFDPARTHLVILDLDLPLKHALEAFGPLASLNVGVPIVIITNQPGHCPSSLMADVAALMQKPVDADLLLRTIDELLAEPKAFHFHPACDCHADSWREPPASRPSTPLATPLQSA